MVLPRRNPRSARRFSGVVAVLSLVAAAVAGGAIAASAAPVSVTIATPSGSTVDAETVVEGTMEWENDGFGGTVAVVVQNADHPGGVVFCEGASYSYADSTWSCPGVQLAFGENVITAVAEQESDPGNPIQTATSITLARGGTADVLIVSPPDTGSLVGLAATFSGTGPELGSVTVEARRDGTEEPFATVCSVDAVGTDGTWSCAGDPFPGGYGRYVVRAIGETITGDPVTAAAPQTFHLQPQKPAVSIDATPGNLSGTITAEADQDSGAWWNYWADDEAPQDFVVSCPLDWPFDYDTPPTAGAEIVCDAGAPVAGSYLLSANSFANNGYSSNSGTLVRIPATPAIASAVDG